MRSIKTVICRTKLRKSYGTRLFLSDDIINADGQVVEQGKQGGVDTGFKLDSKDAKEGKLALFRCKVDGKDKYVIPVYGNGLWGPINGFIALNEDKATIFGVYFNHESETAGLGAEIKDSKDWQDKSKGKNNLRCTETEHRFQCNKEGREARMPGRCCNRSYLNK